MKHLGFIAALLLCCPSRASAAEWWQAGLNTNQPLWGLHGGLQFAIHPAGFRGATGGPRGLIRIGSPVLAQGRYDLVNFIAVEPVVKGRKGFSELEQSSLDQTKGKRIWAGAATNEEKPAASLQPGTISRPTAGVDQLDVILRVEKFDNGAHVYLVVSQRSDAPDEIQFTIHSEPGGAPMDYCILTATMGNMARARQLWLKDEMVSSLKLYPDYTGTGFAEHTLYPLSRLHVTPPGDILVAITTDEENPAAVRPFPNSNLWYYGGSRVTQFWKKQKGGFREDLLVAVNARFTYWQSVRPIPGGVAFENFELRERFHEGQRFIFGLTFKTPKELGFSAK
ncbi:MAG: hypothetical protein AAB466_12440 [Verrucomicrobiota bacterium]